jgi:Tfp pilus assembly protein PilV
MPKVKQRPSAATIVSKDALEQAGVRLQELPDKPKEFWSLREAVAILQDEITIALNRGYTYDEVVEILADKDISITASSLKRYLATARRERNGSTRRTRRPRKSHDEAVAEAPSAQSPVKKGRKTTRSAAKVASVGKSRTSVVTKQSIPTTSSKRGRKSAK